MQHKPFVKLVPIVILAGFSMLVLARIRSSEVRGSTWNPLPPKVEKAINDQYKRSDEAEQQARQLLAARRFEDAKQACAHAIALSPKFNGEPSMIQPIYQLLGDINREQGHYQEAIDAYLKGRENIMTNDRQPELNLALCYLKLGELTNARKFYDEDTFFKGGIGASPEKKAQYMAQLPGTQTAQAMEASLYFARGCEKSSHAELEEAIVDFKKVLVLFPHNALVASRIASNLDFFGSNDGTAYWARVAVFGKGDVAKEAQHELQSRMTPEKVEQALDEARKVKE